MKSFRATDLHSTQ